MSKDWKPIEQLLVESHHKKQGLPDMWQFMENLVLSVDNGKTYAPYVPKEEIELRKKYGNFGKLYENFVQLYKEITVFPNGEAVLRKTEKELENFIATGEGSPNSYVIRWYKGELDPCFYYRERNNEVLHQYLLDIAR